ncbi:hypothetical protein ACIRJR_16595 [Streptomyces sp. NPDC102402]|uniref:hypothetical protein n=1 Tax=Streptomyces sp. NPDC102402 TaxID=3366169 RepID=UPI00380708CC
MDVIALLEAASLLSPEERATADDLTVSDIWDHLTRDEWDVALAMLEELVDVPPPPPAFWEDMATVAEQLGMERSTAWCRWRSYETRYGVIRADLTLRPASETWRRTPVTGSGVLRPMWDIGNTAPDGGPALDIAALWVEFLPCLAPGGRAPVRLAPLDPSRWLHLRPGQVITMYEDRSVSATAVVLETRRPTAAPSRQGRPPVPERERGPPGPGHQLGHSRVNPARPAVMTPTRGPRRLSDSP